MGRLAVGFDAFDNPTAKFPLPVSVGEREWGTEDILVHSPRNWTLKLIRMKEGARGGLQYHRQKDEGGWMVYGSMQVRYDDGTGRLVDRVVRPGDAFHFPAGAVHQSIALTPCAYVEASTPHFNDRVHVEGAYGIEEEAGGLPTTHISEIEVR
jgi:mannose-6-phosphate isomerase-like protein (cupin superfamily)